MTRKEQIEKAASGAPDKNMETAFIAGAEWADENPRMDEQFIDMAAHRTVLAKLEASYADFKKLQNENYELSTKLNISMEALERIEWRNVDIEGSRQIAYEALASIKEER